MGPRVVGPNAYQFAFHRLPAARIQRHSQFTPQFVWRLKAATTESGMSSVSGIKVNYVGFHVSSKVQRVRLTSPFLPPVSTFFSHGQPLSYMMREDLLKDEAV
jgi:hypothetical protein